MCAMALGAALWLCSAAASPVPQTTPSPAGLGAGTPPADAAPALASPPDPPPADPSGGSRAISRTYPPTVTPMTAPAQVPATVTVPARRASASDATRPAEPNLATQSSSRPRFSFAVGAGTSIDHSGLVDGRNVPVPAFQVLLGIGDGPFGFEAALMSTQASGRYRRSRDSVDDMGVDRAAVDLLLALRPPSLRGANDPSGPAAASALARIGQSLTFDTGFTIERVAPGQQSAFRLGYVLGLHADILSLGDDSEGRSFAIRVSARRMFAPRSTVSMIAVSDTVLDAFVSLVAGF